MQFGQKSFEINPTVKRGHAFRRFVTPLTLRCVKCLAPLLRTHRACETQHQWTNRQSDTATYHRHWSTPQAARHYISSPLMGTLASSTR